MKIVFFAFSLLFAFGIVQYAKPDAAVLMANCPCDSGTPVTFSGTDMQHNKSVGVQVVDSLGNFAGGTVGCSTDSHGDFSDCSLTRLLPAGTYTATAYTSFSAGKIKLTFEDEISFTVN